MLHLLKTFINILESWSKNLLKGSDGGTFMVVICSYRKEHACLYLSGRRAHFQNLRVCIDYIHTDTS